MSQFQAIDFTERIDNDSHTANFCCTHDSLSETINMVPLGRNNTFLMTDNDIINASMRPSIVDTQITVLSPTCVRYDLLSGTDDDGNIQSHAVHEGSHPDSLSPCPFETHEERS